jgi:hypothetical protein
MYYITESVQNIQRIHSKAFKGGPRHVGAPGRLIIWCPLNPIFFKYLFNISKVQHISDSFQRCRSAAYRLAPRAAARLARPLIHPCTRFKRLVEESWGPLQHGGLGPWPLWPHLNLGVVSMIGNPYVSLQLCWNNAVINC